MNNFIKLALGALLLTAFSLSAHQQKTSISTVLFNPRTENIEIMHRFRVHDAEHAVKEIFGKDADILDSEKTQNEFSDYVSKRFYLFDSQQKALPLKVVGHEIEGKFFWVYQETTQPAKLENLSIRHDALRDLWPQQVNTINVEGKGELQTLTFADSVELLKVSFH
ncbi:hypothetical protein Q4567_10650 [Aliiglaciecola sp. 2_MG-2023]|uniref:DUF6702 family protein n=1 Tax=unclassified Aliiglaciecola TaxID=2593648 RepID=UPI0026E139F0|nr:MULTISPECIES: DUF6702 family protein [unclassified Aliiglaciecola]MDO6711182.1 hypothetical protein [Aliiglaciecola sp. 2_MG-2023]MDO6752096.1 hypothetical protein [Aliiglaciecola sp. 1_MG-2023]